MSAILISLQASCCSDPHLYFITGQLLFRSPDKGGLDTSDGMQGGYQLGMPRNEFAVVVGDALEALHFRFVARNFPVTLLCDSFGIRLYSLRGHDASQGFDFGLHEVTFSNSHFETSFAQAFKRPRGGAPCGLPPFLWQ